jgi:hypothetical protein
MKNLLSFPFFHPTWLARQVTFHLDHYYMLADFGLSLLGLAAGAAVSLFGQSKQEKANAKATAEQNELARELNRENNQYAADAVRLENKRRLANYAMESGRMGGIQSDVARARNMFQRNRLGSLGYMPKLYYDDPNVKTALEALDGTASAQDLYEYMDDVAFNNYVKSLDLDHRYDFEESPNLPRGWEDGPPQVETGGLWGRAPQMAMDQYWADEVGRRRLGQESRPNNPVTGFIQNPFGYWRGRQTLPSIAEPNIAG